MFVGNTKPYTHFNPYEGERKGINSKEFLILVIECSYVFDKIVKDFKEMTFTKSNRKVTGDYGMDEKKDRNLKGEHQGRKTGKGEKEEYRFLREVIKKKPLDKRLVLYRIAWLLGGASVFGLVAALVFYAALSCLEPEEKEKVKFQENTEHVQKDPEKESGQTEGESKQEVTPTPEQQKEEEEKNITKEEFKNLYHEILQVAEEPERSIVTVQGITSAVDWMNNSYEDSSQVSGLLVADSGKEYFVLTEYRAVDQVDRILVTFEDNATVDAHFLKRDCATGLAVLKIDKEEVTEETRKVISLAKLGSSATIQRGDTVLAIGSPAGYRDSISVGMITSVSNTKNTLDNEYHLLTTDIMGNNEGSGVLVGTDGSIVGIIAQPFCTAKDKNVVTALPITELRKTIEQLSNNESIMYLGIRGQNIESDLSQKTGMPKGIYVNAVEEDSPAMEGGIQNGDVIIKMQDVNVETLSDLRKELDKCEEKQKIQVTAMRKGAEGYVEIVFDVTVGAL